MLTIIHTYGHSLPLIYLIRSQYDTGNIDYADISSVGYTI